MGSCDGGRYKSNEKGWGRGRSWNYSVNCPKFQMCSVSEKSQRTSIQNGRWKRDDRRHGLRQAQNRYVETEQYHHSSLLMEKKNLLAAKNKGDNGKWVLIALPAKKRKGIHERTGTSHKLTRRKVVRERLTYL